ncbi:MAG: flotillin domain-containing protein [Cyanobacteria bacterium J06641_5]
MLMWLELLQRVSKANLHLGGPNLQPEASRMRDRPQVLTLGEPIAELETTEIILAQSQQPLTTANIIKDIGFTGFAAIGVVGLILAGVAVLVIASAIRSLYKVTPANEAFVKTGGFPGGPRRRTVIKHGGCIVVPTLDELTRVPLKEISIDVVRTGNLAVRTQDYLRADMRVTFFVCINAEDVDIKTATERLSQDGKITTNDIKNAIEKRADDAIRAAAKSKTLAEIDSDKLGFAQEVLNLIEPDLKKVGLTLNNIAISEVEESDTYDVNNFFDAQGVKLRTETIQRSIQQQREVELTTRVSIEEKELEAQKRSLDISRDNESAQLNQRLELESLRAQRQREIQESQDTEAAQTERNKILQERSVEEERILNQRATEEKQIEADIALEESRKRLKVTQALQKQEAELAEIDRQKLTEANRLLARVEVAEAEQQSQIAQEAAAIAIARKEQERLAAEAERATAESAVQTAIALEEAERQRRLTAITANQEAEKQRISEENVVEIDVFRRRRQAEAFRQAAELEAESIRTLADANRDKALAEAEGKQAIVEAENALSDANRTAELIRDLWPELVKELPQVIKALTPQPGILGDARIYAFPGANGGNGDGGGGSGLGEINKLMLSASGFALLNSLLESGKFDAIAGQIKQLLQGQGINPNDLGDAPAKSDTEQTYNLSDDD